ncbi:LysR family transcriptional regulator [Aidingimonas lacisalsi]|uniref:LysR family transcriptional regulator n=1 Tax=Aidingimonas lacisalsi TaxID=2604086 RepID=UPI0011D1B14E|nr:LysR family transcriptional regulator [Aidingimonas lacisalsi]
MIRGTEITVSQLRAFLCVVEERSYTKAADRLGVSQSGVSHSLQSLERVVGGQLLRKEHNELHVTALGEIVVTSAKKILSELGTLNYQLENMKGAVDKSLRIGGIPSVLKGLMTPFIDDFSKRYPRSVSLVLEGVEDEVKEWVESGVIDIGFITDITHINAAYWRENFSWEEVCCDEILAVLPESHELATYEAIGVSTLTDYPLIMSSGGCEALIHQIFAKSLDDTHSFQIDFWVRDTATLLDMVAADVGISLVPRLALHSHSTKKVAVKSLTPNIDRTVIAFWPKRQPIGKVGTLFLEHLIGDNR